MRGKRTFFLLTLLALLLAACGGAQEASPSVPDDAWKTAVGPQFVEFYADW